MDALMMKKKGMAGMDCDMDEMDAESASLDELIEMLAEKIRGVVRAKKTPPMPQVAVEMPMGEEEEEDDEYA